MTHRSTSRPGAIFRSRLGLLGRTLAKVEETEQTVENLIGGNVPDQVREVFDRYRHMVDETKRALGRQLAQAVAPLN